MFFSRDLCCVLCSRDLDVLRAQRIMGLFNYPQINAVGISDHMVRAAYREANKCFSTGGRGIVLESSALLTGSLIRDNGSGNFPGERNEYWESKPTTFAVCEHIVKHVSISLL